MTELQDHWKMEHLYNMIEYDRIVRNIEIRPKLRLTNDIWVNPHKPNSLNIPFDELPEYKRDRKIYLNLPGKYDRNNKRIYKDNRKLRKTSQNKVHTDPILSKKRRNILSREKRVRFNI